MKATGLPLFLVAVWLLQGCDPVSLRAPERRPVRWILVEKEPGDVFPGGQVGDGRLDPRSRILTLEPLYPEDLQWAVVVDPQDSVVEVLEISPGAAANPGEIVTAKVRVGRTRLGESYRLSASPSRPGVTIVGSRAQIVLEGAPALFRFTSASIGPGGITVGVDRIPAGQTPPR